MKDKLEKNLVIIFLCLLFLFLAILSYYSKGSYGGSDDPVHYRIARYAFQKPSLFLDHWGKPIFTVLSAPFAQLGYYGLRIFNVLAATLTAYFTYLTAKKLDYKNPYLVISFVIFAPIYFIITLSGMTEILFSLILTLTVFLFFDKKYIVSAMVASLLPITRTESITIIPFFIIAHIIIKNYKSLPFFLSGFLMYSIVGSFYYHDFFWLINEMPYTGAKDIYGSGKLLHFVYSKNEIFGNILSIFLCIGILTLLKNFFTTIRQPINQNVFELLLIFFPLFTFISIHSIAWWLGLGGSIGLTRVMACIIPLAALLCLKGINLFDKILSIQIWVKALSFALLLFFIVPLPFKLFQIPVPLSPSQELAKQASDWVKSQNFYNEKIYYYDSYFYFFLNLNPYDNTRIEECIPNREKPEEGLAKNIIVLWDAHFGPNEGKMPLQRLKSNPHFKILKVFKPKEAFQTLGGYNYEIYVFQKITD